MPTPEKYRVQAGTIFSYDRTMRLWHIYCGSRRGKHITRVRVNDQGSFLARVSIAVKTKKVEQNNLKSEPDLHNPYTNTRLVTSNICRAL